MDNDLLNDKTRVTYFGLTDFRGNAEKFGIKADDRTRHTYVIGKTGMGKSTMLENMAIQDIQNGEGLCFVDPHGTTAEKLLKYVPAHRMNDVVYFAPFDTKYPFALNILEHVDEDYRHLVASGLMDTFKKVFGEDVFSGRMVYLLNNAILSLLENEGESLMGINRIYADKDYRKKIIANVKDPAVISFWRDEFAKYEDKYVKEATAAIQNKIGQFIMTPMVRNIVGQTKTSFDLRDIMDKRKILICNFSIGQTGSENVNLIGSLLITKIYLAAMSRANLSYDDLQKAPPFYFYVDEFQNFVNDSFAQILSQARKYNLGLTIAHQYIEQLTDNVKAAVFGNVGTLIVFRVGATDAEMLEKEFAPNFTIDDIVNLGSRQIYLRLSIDGVGSKPFSARTLPPIEDVQLDIVPAIIASSRAQFGKAKKDVEEEIMSWYQPIIAPRSEVKTLSPENNHNRDYLGSTKDNNNNNTNKVQSRRSYESTARRPTNVNDRLNMKSRPERQESEVSRKSEDKPIANNSLRDALANVTKLQSIVTPIKSDIKKDNTLKESAISVKDIEKIMDLDNTNN
jgi:Type IV secretion-system coupling protein DNA-binding domain